MTTLVIAVFHVVRLVRGLWALLRAYLTGLFLLATGAALAGIGRLLGLSEPVAWLIPIGVLVLAIHRAAPPRPWTRPWPLVLLIDTPPRTTDVLLRWLHGYLIVVCSVGALLVPLMIIVAILEFGFGIRWLW